MVLTLYKKDTSAPCMSVFMVLEDLNIKNVNYVDMNLQQRDHYSPDYLKINPQHTIPTLKDDDFVIWDSHAIVTYLVTKYAKDDSLYPKDPQRRAIIDQRLHFDSGVIFPALRQSMIPLLYHGERSVRQENLEKIKIGYEILENFFTGAWLAGDSVTLADICCFSTIGSLKELLSIDASLYPNLSAWVDRCSKLEIHVKSCASARKAYQNLLKNILA